MLAHVGLCVYEAFSSVAPGDHLHEKMQEIIPILTQKDERGSLGAPATVGPVDLRTQTQS